MYHYAPLNVWPPYRIMIAYGVVWYWISCILIMGCSILCGEFVLILCWQVLVEFILQVTASYQNLYRKYFLETKKTSISVGNNHAENIGSNYNKISVFGGVDFIFKMSNIAPFVNQVLLIEPTPICLLLNCHRCPFT